MVTHTFSPDSLRSSSESQQADDITHGAVGAVQKLLTDGDSSECESDLLRGQWFRVQGLGGGYLL